RWLGRCPGCGSFGTLNEESPEPTRANGAAPRPLLRLVDVEAEEAKRIPTGVSELDRVLGGGLVPASLVLVGGEPGVGKSTLLLMALRAMSQQRRALLVTGEESAAQVRMRAERLGGAGSIEILADTDLDAICTTLGSERPAGCVIDSVHTLYSAEVRSGPGAGAPPAARRQGGWCRALSRRSRHQGRRRRRPARPRAPGRLRAPVRGRSLPRASRPACRQEPLRLDERAGRLRDDRRWARGRADPIADLGGRPGRGGWIGRRVCARGHEAAAARGSGSCLSDGSGDAQAGRDGCRSEAAPGDCVSPHGA